MHSGASLASAAAVLKTGVKRVPVLNDEGRVVFIISQTALNRFLYDHVCVPPLPPRFCAGKTKANEQTHDR